MIHNTFNDFIKSQKKYTKKDEALRIIYEATGLSGVQDIIEDFELKEYPRDSEVIVFNNSYYIDIDSWRNFIARVDNHESIMLIDQQYPINCRIFENKNYDGGKYAYITIVITFGDLNKRKMTQI